MKTIEQIQNLPVKERKQLFVIILLGVFVVMVGAWVVLSQLPSNKDRNKETLVKNIQDNLLKAQAGFKELQPK
jgi:Tfp pilus assembly protein PilO